MRIIIHQGSRKPRELVGSFRIYGTRADIELIRDQLSQALTNPSWDEGWVCLVEPIEAVAARVAARLHGYRREGRVNERHDF